MPPIVVSKKIDVVHRAYAFRCIAKRNGGVVPSQAVWGGAATRDLEMRSSKKAAFCAPTACERSHCFFPFWRDEFRKMDHHGRKTMFRGLI